VDGIDRAAVLAFLVARMSPHAILLHATTAAPARIGAAMPAGGLGITTTTITTTTSSRTGRG
jgi:hypothetical protein